MMEKVKVKEIIFTCDINGYVLEILEQSEDFSNMFKIGDLFFNRVYPQNLSKALEFFSELKNSKIVTDYEVNFIIDKVTKTFILSGAHDKNGFIILVSNSRLENQIYDDLMIINNEQINIFRKEIKEKVDKESLPANFDINYYDEISRLNNELTNVQRELAKKNSELNTLNKQLEELTIRDALTGLYNKRHLVSKYKEETSRSQRFGYPISIAMIDFNNFKKINDTLGHNEGDLILQKFAEITNLFIREELDYVFRIGGDEFVILLTHCEEDTAINILERLDGEFRKHTDISSLSYGVSSFIGNSYKSLDILLKETDEKMYEFKKNSKVKQEKPER